MISLIKSIFHYVRFTRPGKVYIVFETRHALVSRFSKAALRAQESDCNEKMPFSVFLYNFIVYFTRFTSEKVAKA